MKIQDIKEIKNLLDLGHDWIDIFKLKSYGYRSTSSLTSCFYRSIKNDKETCLECGRVGTKNNIIEFGSKKLCRSCMCYQSDPIDDLEKCRMLWLAIINLTIRDVKKAVKSNSIRDISELKRFFNHSEQVINICENAGINLKYLQRKVRGLGL